MPATLLTRSLNLPWPSPSAVHEAGHAVAAVLLGRPFLSLHLDAGGGQMLGSGPLRTAEDLIAEAAVSAAGAFCEFLFATSLEHATSDQVVRHLSDGDRRAIAILATKFAQSFPGRAWPWPFSALAEVFSRPGAETAVKGLARLLQHRGKLTEAEVIELVQEARNQGG